MKFGIFYEHQLPRPWDADRNIASFTRPSIRSSSPTDSASTTPGKSSTTSSRSIRTPPRPKCSSPPARNAPSAFASATASC